jgi:quinol monooxygenase YgiN
MVSPSRKGGDAFDRLTSETVEQIRAHEPGTLLYAVHRVESDPDARLFYEVYRDRAAFDDHEAQPHTRRFLAERGQYLTGFDVDELSVTVARKFHDNAVRSLRRSARPSSRPNARPS